MSQFTVTVADSAVVASSMGLIRGGTRFRYGGLPLKLQRIELAIDFGDVTVSRLSMSIDIRHERQLLIILNLLCHDGHFVIVQHLPSLKVLIHHTTCTNLFW